MTKKCVLACSPAPIVPYTELSLRAKYLAPIAPKQAVLKAVIKVPSTIANGKPVLISDNNITPLTFCLLKSLGLLGNTETHLTPHTPSFNKVEGIQLIRV